MLNYDTLQNSTWTSDLICQSSQESDINFFPPPSLPTSHGVINTGVS